MAKNEEIEAEPIVEAAVDNDGVPYCVKHHCRMKQSSGGKRGSMVSYYSCPVDGCNETAKMLKPDHDKVVPNQPQACPRCSGRGGPVYCERDTDHSDRSKTVLKCPSCGWKSTALARPELAAFMKRPAFRNSETVGAR